MKLKRNRCTYILVFLGIIALLGGVYFATLILDPFVDYHGVLLRVSELDEKFPGPRYCVATEHAPLPGRVYCFDTAQDANDFSDKRSKIQDQLQ